MDWKDFDNPEAEKVYFERMIRIHPEDPYLYYELGAVHAYLLSYDKAIHYCQKAIKLAPKNLIFHEFMGFVYRKKGNIEKSVKCFEKLISLCPDDSHYILELALMYDEMGNQKGLLDQLGKLRELGLKHNSQNTVAKGE